MKLSKIIPWFTISSSLFNSFKKPSCCYSMFLWKEICSKFTYSSNIFVKFSNFTVTSQNLSSAWYFFAYESSLKTINAKEKSGASDSADKLSNFPTYWLKKSVRIYCKMHFWMDRCKIQTWLASSIFNMKLLIFPSGNLLFKLSVSFLV